MAEERFHAIEEKLDAIEARYAQLEEQMAAPDVATDPRRLMELGRERADLTELVETYRRFREIKRHVDETQGLLREGGDPEMDDLARVELESLNEQLDASISELKRMLLPKDPNDDKNVIIE